MKRTLKIETESTIQAAQVQALFTNWRVNLRNENVFAAIPLLE